MTDRARWAVICLVAFVAIEFVVSVAAQTISRNPSITEQSPQDLWEFLAAVPGSFEAQQFLGLMIAGSIGYVAHYALKWARNEIREGLWRYFTENFRSTVLSLFTYIGLSATAIGSGAFIGEYGGFVGWKVLFWMGITNGFAIDAIVNKTERARWQPEERWSRQRKPPRP